MVGSTRSRIAPGSLQHRGQNLRDHWVTTPSAVSRCRPRTYPAVGKGPEGARHSALGRNSSRFAWMASRDRRRAGCNHLSKRSEPATVTRWSRLHSTPSCRQSDGVLFKFSEQVGVATRYPPLSTPPDYVDFPDCDGKCLRNKEICRRNPRVTRHSQRD